MSMHFPGLVGETRARGLRCAAVALLLTTTALPGRAAPPAPSPGTAPKAGAPAHALPDSVTFVIGNRLFPDFREVITTRMHRREQVGDTDYSFEVLAFFASFAMIDSTKQFVSLSDEPNNPAFRIRVYEKDAAVDSTWAFYRMNAPHFTRTSYLWFQAVRFGYRGAVYDKAATQKPEQPAAKGGKKSHP